ncbi:MAG: amidohydrolase [Anaerolineae bacterium]
MTSILIKNCSILNQHSPHGHLENQDILIHGKTIHSIGPTDPARTAETIIDGWDMLAIPGLINAHTHSIETVFRGASEGLPLELWLIQQSAYRAAFPPRLLYLIALAGATEMLRSGTTAALDHFWMVSSLTNKGLDAVMQAYAEVGLRVSLAPMLEDQDLVFDVLAAAYPPLAAVAGEQSKATDLLDLTQDFLKRWHGREDGRLLGLPGPGGAQWCSEALLTGCRDLTERFGTGLHMHVAETHLQTHICQHAYGHPVMVELDRLGLLKPNSSLAHCIWLTETELDLLARTQAKVVHNPASNLKLGSGVAAIPAMLQRGIQVALGTDGAASNDNQNMFETLKLTALLHSPALKSDLWLPAHQVIEMGTVAGAAVLGYPDNLGRLEPGFLADIVLLDLSRAPLDTLENASAYLVYAETGASVCHVIVNGRLVVEQGQVLTVSEDEVYRELRGELRAFNAAHPRPLDKLQALLDEYSQALQQWGQQRHV